MKEDPEGVEKSRRRRQEALRADLQGVMSASGRPDIVSRARDHRAARPAGRHGAHSRSTFRCRFCSCFAAIAVRAGRSADLVARLLQPGRPVAGALTLDNFRSLFTDPEFLDPLITTFIIAVSSSALLLRGRGADGLARRAHRPAVDRRDTRAGDGLVRDAAVPRRDRLGDPGRAQQRPAQPALPLRHGRAAGRAPAQHLLDAGPDLRHLLLHVSLRLRADRERARSHSRRPRRCLRDARRPAPGRRRAG